MNYNQILAYIAAWIIDNQNKEITAAIMRDVLDKLVNFTDDRTGDTDNLEQGNDLTDAFNILFGQVQDISIDHPVNVHVGEFDPNITPPANFSAPDFYIQNDNVVWLYNGTTWVKIIDSSKPQVPSLQQVLGIGNVANQRIIGNDYFDEKSDNDFAQIQDVFDAIPAATGDNQKPETATYYFTYDLKNIEASNPTEDFLLVEDDEEYYFGQKNGNVINFENCTLVIDSSGYKYDFGTPITVSGYTFWKIGQTSEISLTAANGEASFSYYRKFVDEGINPQRKITRDAIILPSDDKKTIFLEGTGITVAINLPIETYPEAFTIACNNIHDTEDVTLKIVAVEGWSYKINTNATVTFDAITQDVSFNIPSGGTFTIIRDGSTNTLIITGNVE